MFSAFGVFVPDGKEAFLNAAKAALELYVAMLDEDDPDAWSISLNNRWSQYADFIEGCDAELLLHPT